MCLCVSNTNICNKSNNHKIKTQQSALGDQLTNLLFLSSQRKQLIRRQIRGLIATFPPEAPQLHYPSPNVYFNQLFISLITPGKTKCHSVLSKTRLGNFPPYLDVCKSSQYPVWTVINLSLRYLSVMFLSTTEVLVFTFVNYI